MHYPKVNLGNRVPNSDTDIAWAEGVMSDGRPFYMEIWLGPYITCLTCYISAIAIENVSPTDIKNLFVSDGLLTFNDEKYHSEFGQDGQNIKVEKFIDESKNEMLAINSLIGDEDGTYVYVLAPKKKFIFPSIVQDPFLYSNEGKTHETANYYLLLCEEPLKKDDNYQIYQPYFVNNTEKTIEFTAVQLTFE
jgi:hypothetical protein